MWTIKLGSLIKSSYFHNPCREPVCYSVAGSFTGFLIRRFGWTKYRKLYRWCNGLAFRWKFKYCFGVTLPEAESQWRRELLSR
jgi:hypothetical protein